MTHALLLADLQALAPLERQAALTRIVAEATAPANGQAIATLARIRAYERRYEVTSSTLLTRLARGEIRETAEIAEWLFCLRVQRGGSGEKARSEQAL